MVKTIAQLKVENEVFDFGLTNEEITKIEEMGKTLKKYDGEKVNNYSLDIRGVYEGKKTSWVISVGSRHYSDNNEIKVERKSKDNWIENKGVFNVENKYFFKFFPSVDEFKKFASWKSLASNLVDSYGYGGRESEKKQEWASMKEVETYFKSEMMAHIKKGRTGSFDEDDNVEYEKSDMVAFCHLFGKDTKVLKDKTMKNLPTGLNKILLVVEQDNTRVFIYQKGIFEKGSTYTQNRIEYAFASEKSDSRDYNYIDEERMFVQRGYSNNKLYLFDDLKKYELGILTEISKETPELVINQAQYDRYQKRCALKVLKEEKEEGLKGKYVEALKEIKSDVAKKSFTYNEMTFSNEGIEYGGMKLSVISVEEHKSFTYNAQFIKELDLDTGIDFNTITGKFCSDICRAGKKVEMIIGKIKVKGN
jgi:hypothetical protein